MAADLRTTGLELFRSLIKDGCQWHGDVLSRKWSECLYYDEKIEAQVMQTLYPYEVGVHYKLEDGAVWIC